RTRRMLRSVDAILLLYALFMIFAMSIITLYFFFSSRRRHTRSVSAFLLNRSSDLGGIASALAGGAMSKLFGGGFLTASKQFRHGATSKSRSNTRSEERFSRNAETDLVCRLLLEKKKENTFTYIDVMNKGMQDE